ncbi:MAG: hypothetical protein ACK52S_15785 [Pirellula sp.]|jgi:hypothetical protein
MMEAQPAPQSRARHYRRASCKLALVLLAAFPSLGCHPLSPKRIDITRQYVAPELIQANGVPMERGKPRPVIDTIGWVIGIPSKLLFWNRKIENHNISAETEYVLAGYLEANNLQHVKVRLNQYRPFDDFRRLTKNRSVAWPWRYTFGTFSVLGEAIVPGRLFGGDHFNPFTNTVHLYSDVPAIALHEAAHAKDFSRRRYQGTYAALYALPVVPLYHESIATSDVMDYGEENVRDPEFQRQAYNVLYPAYGTYVGGAAGTIFPPISFPAYYGSVAVGHLAGRLQSRRIGDDWKGAASTNAVEPIYRYQPEHPMAIMEGEWQGYVAYPGKEAPSYEAPGYETDRAPAMEMDRTISGDELPWNPLPQEAESF